MVASIISQCYQAGSWAGFQVKDGLQTRDGCLFSRGDVLAGCGSGTSQIGSGVHTGQHRVSRYTVTWTLKRHSCVRSERPSAAST